MNQDMMTTGGERREGWMSEEEGKRRGRMEYT